MRSFFFEKMLALVIRQCQHSFFSLNLRLHIIPGVIKILFLKKLAGFFKVPRNPIPWLFSCLVETETGQSTGSCMPCHLS